MGAILAERPSTTRIPGLWLCALMPGPQIACLVEFIARTDSIVNHRNHLYPFTKYQLCRFQNGRAFIFSIHLLCFAMFWVLRRIFIFGKKTTLTILDMKKFKVALTIAIFSFSITLLWSWKELERPKVAYPLPVASPISICGSFTFKWSDTAALARPRILGGLGNLRYPVTTKSAKAREFFEQGLRLVYGFNHWEAIQSFREAARLDPDFAMAHWGLALAFGPNLNDWTPVDRERIAFESIKDALGKSAKASPVEKDFIKALASRYNGKAYDNRDSLNNAYAGAMKVLAAKYPNDPEVQTLYADAIMNTMPWNYWEANHSPKPATAEAKKVLEHILLKFPDHPGAHHLYIHLVEASATPELALKSAKFLETAMPGAGHIVHMPAHIYFRTGDYSKGVDLNVKASRVDEEYLSLSANQGMYRQMYYPHNVDFVGYGSYMAGKSNQGIQSALKLAYKGNFVGPAAAGFYQYFVAEPMIAFTRFGKWTDILALPDPGDKVLFAQVLWHFSRGLALLRSGYTPEALHELVQLDSLNKLDTLKSLYITFNPVSASSEVTSKILRGEILLHQKKFDEAIMHLEEAVKTEDAMRYNEPPDWKIPTRHYLGAALLEAGKFAEAENVYKADLAINRENGWALKGLQQAQEKQGKKVEAGATSKRFAEAWKNADVEIISSRF